jgi:hypothetical protein
MRFKYILAFPFFYLYKFYLNVKVSCNNPVIKLIEGTEVAKLCDYSFGDQTSIICNIPGAKVKEANLKNQDFIDEVKQVSKIRNFMTVFIDNIRLYKRDIVSNTESKIWIDSIMERDNLLNLCSEFSEIKFVIFTNLDDTPIDAHIQRKIPNNVLGIYAVNAIFNNEKVFPFPYGIQRRLWFGDIRKEMLLSNMHHHASPEKLLYINHSIHTNPSERSGIKELFYNKPWATVVDTKLRYNKFLSDIKNHKFVICPIGNAIDCHRNWEVLYMRRVPVMTKNEYLEKLFIDLPVLFVNQFSDLTEELLNNSEFLYQKALSFDMDRLDLKKLFNKSIQHLQNLS